VLLGGEFGEPEVEDVAWIHGVVVSRFGFRITKTVPPPKVQNGSGMPRRAISSISAKACGSIVCQTPGGKSRGSVALVICVNSKR